MSFHRSAAFGGLALALLVLAQGTQAAEPHQHAPYAGLQARPVKALSDQQRADLMAGRGQGLALAAELNGYPGPLHVLELRETLALTPDQTAATEAIMARMKDSAVRLGHDHLRREEALDRLFRGPNAQPAAVTRAVAEAGQSMAALRDAHLQAHLAMAKLLTPAQIDRYRQQRGYAPAAQPGHPADPRLSPPPAPAAGPAGVPLLQRDVPAPDYGGESHDGHAAPGGDVAKPAAGHDHGAPSSAPAAPKPKDGGMGMHHQHHGGH